ncbi:methyltransferase family protein [Dongia mobilis]|uniref:Methyltransferase family protein n=1 Tax=Dongia mobilis TaxID=578943 RepID=A0A4R6WQU6_9PROT|nr:methyltransferase family protein [Dongia mobilis]
MPLAVMSFNPDIWRAQSNSNEKSARRGNILGELRLKQRNHPDPGETVAGQGVVRQHGQGADSSKQMRKLGLFERLLLKYRLRNEPRYVRRWVLRMASGRQHSNLGNDLKDVPRARWAARDWLGYLTSMGLRPHHTCVEVGCGSLWAAEPVIEYLEAGKYTGLDITEQFYRFGEERLGDVLREKAVTLAVISEAALQRLEAMPPDFVFARKVLAHLRPDELPDFVAMFCRLVGPHSIGLIDNPPTEKTRYRNPGTIDYALEEFQRHVPAGITCIQDQWAIVVRREPALEQQEQPTAR